MSDHGIGEPTRKQNRHADERMHEQGAQDRDGQVPAGPVLRKEFLAPCPCGPYSLEHSHRTIICHFERVQQDAQVEAAIAPPSTMMCEPEMNDNSSETRKSAHRSGVRSYNPTRPIDWPGPRLRDTARLTVR